MKSIEERAKVYADRRKEYELMLFGLYRTYNYERIYNSEKVSYEVGASEQKAIDDAELLKLKSAWKKEAQINHDAEKHYKQGYHDAVEKAILWLQIRSEYPFSRLEDSFRTFMEEQLCQ